MWLILKGFFHYSASKNYNSKRIEIEQVYYIAFIYLNDYQFLVLHDNRYSIFTEGYAYFFNGRNYFYLRDKRTSLKLFIKKRSKNYCKRILDELNLSLSYLWDFNVLLGVNWLDPTYLNQFWSGTTRLNNIFIDSFLNDTVKSNILNILKEEIDYMIHVLV